MYGPLKREELPWKDFKVSPMTVRLKPNGRARIIMGLSYPHKIMLGRGEVCSPNEGMANFLEFEPVTMGSDYRWRCKMYRDLPCGSPSQVVEFGGRFFIDRCLNFGGGNSSTYYHMPAPMLITMAEIQSGFDPLLNLIQLDDN